jgi:aspartate/methionine/tyrosine aminotransferase
MSVTSSVRRRIKFNSEIIDFSSGGVCLDSKNTLRDFIDNKILDTRIDSYGDVLGLKGLRMAIARQNILFFKNKISFKNIAITHGANKAFSIVTEAVLKQTKKKGILFFTPYFYDSYENAERNHLKIFTLKRNYIDNFQINIDIFKQTIRQNISEISMVYVVNPDNPTGLYSSNKIIEDISSFCAENKIYLILDHSFYGVDLVNNCLIRNHYTLADTTILIGGLSKTFGLAGLRIGYSIMPKKIIQIYEDIQDTDIIHHPLVDQKIAEKVLEKAEDRLQFVLRSMFVRAQKLRSNLECLPGIKKIHGSYWLAWIRVDRDYLYSKYELSKNFDPTESLLEDHKVGVISGINFDPTLKNYLRIAYGRETKENFQIGLKRLVRFFS